MRNGQQGASLAMALLTGMALLCYIVALARVSAGGRRARGGPSRPAVPAQRDEGWPAALRPSSPRASTSWFTPE